MFSVVRCSLNVVREVVAGWFHKGTGHRPAPAGGKWKVESVEGLVVNDGRFSLILVRGVTFNCPFSTFN